MWEESDGCVFLVREICQSQDAELKKDIPKYLQQLPELGLLDQFYSAVLLKENLFKTLCEILKSVGKKPFRQYIELYLDPAFRTAKGNLFNIVKIFRYKVQLSVPSATVLNGSSEDLWRWYHESYNRKL